MTKGSRLFLEIDLLQYMPSALPALYTYNVDYSIQKT